MKKIIVSAMTLMTVLALAGCGGGDKKEAPKVAASKGKPVVIYTAAEDERIAFLKDEFKKKFPDKEVVLQSLGTGQMLSKLQAEGKNTSCDIFYDLEVINAEIIMNGNPDLFADLSSYDFSIYDKSVTGYTNRHKKVAVNGKTYGAFLVNDKVLKAKNLPTPKSYNDLLKPEYKGLVVMPSPKSSGTGYSMYNGMISLLGNEKGMDYFKALNPNIKEYTTSGSAPVKSVVRGDTAIGLGLLWQCVEKANKDKANMHFVVLDDKAPFALFTMGMINGKDKNPDVKAVFDYLYNDLNKRQVAKFNPGKVYANQLPAEIANYPQAVAEIDMVKLFDFKYKQDMLDKWNF